jgi:pyruvate/2-oxoglutarate dehydrogenase complex dihydrolipoamide dehydrogenase (E3) component
MFDVVVVGGGPAGVTAALRAAELGATVVLVERGNLGGTCTNDGCVPTRVLAKAARLMRDAEQFADYGLRGEKPELDFAALLARTQQAVYRVHEKKQLRAHLEEAGVRVFANSGDAHFEDAHALALADGTRVEGAKYILCVGGHARRLPFPGGEFALTHSDVWRLTQLPRSVVVVGGAATGCQLASVFEAFGARVSLLEVGPRLLANEDSVVSEGIGAAFARRGIEIVTGIGGVERIERADGILRLHYTHEGQARAVEAEAVVLAVGWPGNVEALNLAAAGVEAQRGYITVDDTLRTTAPHIYAAGDCTGRMMLVQTGCDEGTLAAENAILSVGQVSRHGIAPHGGFTDPEYGSVGLREDQARAAFDCEVASVAYAEMDRAVIDGHMDGVCKLIAARETHQIVGAHIVGEQAVEILQLVATAMAGRMSVEQLAHVELAYPTFTAIVGLAARRIVRQLGSVPLSPRWRLLGDPGAAEWERRERDGAKIPLS